MSTPSPPSPSPRRPALMLAVQTPGDNSDEDEFPSAPSPLALSPTALELVPEPEGSPEPLLFEFSDDEDGVGDGPSDGLAGAFSRLSNGPIPPLPPLNVLLFAFIPTLRLGAFLIPYQSTPLVKAIPALVLFAALAALARQIWYMLARYVGTADVETVIAMTFARAPRRSKARKVIRLTTRTITTIFRILLAATYLREYVDALKPYYHNPFVLSDTIQLLLIAGLFILTLSWTPSIGTKRIAITNWISVLLFVIWFSLAAAAHAKGMLTNSIPPEGRGRLWADIPVIAFALATLWDIPLYAALKAKSRPGPRSLISAGARRVRSFRIVSLVASAISVGLVLPLLFFGPTEPESTIVLREDRSLNAAMAVLSAVMLVLAVPPLIITTQSGPMTQGQPNLRVSRTIPFIIVMLLASVPDWAAAAQSDITLFLALVGNYFVPAFLHIAIHQFKRPLSILLPSRAAPTISNTQDDSDDERAPLTPRIDELLVQKERALQRKRLLRRVAWDVAVWTMLLPVGGGGTIWAVGRLAGAW